MDKQGQARTSTDGHEKMEREFRQDRKSLLCMVEELEEAFIYTNPESVRER